VRPLLLALFPLGLMAQTQTSTTTQTSTAHPKTTAHPNTTMTRSTATGHTAVRRAAAKPTGPTITTEEQKTVYAIGLFVYQRSLVQLDLSPDELMIVKQAFSDAAAGKPAEQLEDYRTKLQAFATQRGARKAEQAKAASVDMLAKAAAEPGAVKTDSGLVYRDDRVGTGASPQPTDTVSVNYRGTLADGTEFDSSYKRNEPAKFGLNHVIKCWTGGLQKMKVGGKAILICPSSLAYGDQGQSGIPPGAALKFEVELLDIVPPAAGK
jgi:FKBP-type peptidyl-prolyl cis-trans isomerase FkpA